ncbi:hypothetical protein CCHR01_13521 [Colletotrichum chrysophilum]|uniref:Uncharacterized protein n=1 Tax=Colletotrichum chrysophilum TaxID=1836956 RepID=A0AAD9A9T2_9PEZI|nr:hypothetical protein CCHR01_13521 [Colletotrichum chrysophilum]
MLPKAADTNRSKRRRRPCIQSSRKRGSTGSDSHGRRPVWRPPRRLMPFGRNISKPRACRQIENFVQTFPIIGLLFKQTQEYGLAPISLSQALGGQSSLLNSTWCSFFSIPFQCKCVVYFASNTLIRQTSLVLAPGGGIMLLRPLVLVNSLPDAMALPCHRLLARLDVGGGARCKFCFVRDRIENQIPLAAAACCAAGSVTKVPSHTRLSHTLPHDHSLVI